MSPLNLLLVGLCAVAIGFILSVIMFIYAVAAVAPGERSQVIGESIKTFLFSVLSLVLLLGVYYL